MHPVIAANCSKELLELMEENPGIVDAVKVSEFYDQSYMDMYRRIAESKPLILHGVCQDYRRGGARSPGNPGFAESLHGGFLRAGLELCRPEYISVHLEHYTEQHCDPEVFLDGLVRDVRLLKEITGLPVHLENTHFNFPRPGRTINAPYAANPEFISKALDVTGSRLLLDIAHAQTAAWHLGERAIDYISRLPLELVDEVHVTAPAMVDGQLRDRHEEMADVEYGLLLLVMARARVKTISLEFGGLGSPFEGRGPKPALRRQLERLRDIATRVTG